MHNKNKLLLVKVWLSDGSWTLPGGGRKRNEPAIAAVQRELREETGIDVPIEQLEVVGSCRFSAQGLKFDYDLFTAALQHPPTLRARRGEIIEVQWFTPKQLTEAKLAMDVMEYLKRL